MPSRPSPETELRSLKKRFKEHDNALRETRIQLQEYRARTNRAEGEVSEWKKRFDLLLKRTPEALVVSGTPPDPSVCTICGGRHGANMPCPKLAPMCSTNAGDSEHG